LAASVLQAAAQFEGAYLRSDVYQTQRILWQIKGEHVQQMSFRPAVGNRSGWIFRDLVIGEIPRRTWAQRHLSLPVISNGAQIGTLEYSIDWFELNKFSLTQNLLLFATVTTFVLCLLILSNIGTIKTLVLMEDGIAEANRLIESQEYDMIPQTIQNRVSRLPSGSIGTPFAALSSRLVEIIRRASDLETELRLSKAVSTIAAQVAHDIRSPLAALDSVTKDVAQLPEEKRVIIRTAVSRIRDIANDLIEKNRGLDAMGKDAARGAPSPAAAEPASIQLLSGLVDPLITEKRLQFRPKIGIEIEARLDAAAYGLFAKVQPIEFKRVLSNLVNNSVEACDEKGLVMVSLAAEAGCVLLKVQDNGKGIPPEILAKLGQRGETHGKVGGSGLGLHHAKTSIESWAGSLQMASEVGQGTTVTIRLPQAQPPEWFVSRLEIPPGGTIVVLDDDASIHQIWQGRFDSLRVKEQGVELLHFSTPAELRGFVRESPAQARWALYLTDYELVGHKETGLGLVEELGLGERAILITSRSEEKSILAECQRLKVRMIPKGLAGFVPISISASPVRPETQRPRQSGPDAVLLDDDALVRMNWKGTARSKGLNLIAFAKPQEFLAAVAGFPKDTAIYLDSKLGDGIRGEDIAKDLHAQGFTNLYLATGYDQDSLSPMPWIKKVVGKAPPWG